MTLAKTTIKALDALKISNPSVYSDVSEGIERTGCKINTTDLRRIEAYIEALQNEEVLELERITIITVPFGARRPRATKQGLGIRVYAHPNDTRDKGAFLALLRPILDDFGYDFSLILGEVEIKFNFFMPIDSNFTNAQRVLAEMKYIRPLRKPDTDNLQKMYLDAMSGVMYDDDIQVVSLGGEKWYSVEPRIEMDFVLKPNIINIKDL